MERTEEYTQFCALHSLQTVVIVGRRWQYIDTGEGKETLLLLPGGFGVADTAFRLITAFSRSYRVISVTYPPTITTCTDLVDSLAVLLRNLKVDTTHVVGGSASGLIAQVLVRRHPSLVRSLILSHTSVPRQVRACWVGCLLGLLGMAPFPLVRGAFHASVRAFLPANNGEQRFWREYFHARIDELSRDSLLNRFRVLIDIDRHQRFTPSDLVAWRHPLLVIAAEDDGFVGKREQATLKRLYPQAHYQVLRCGTHRDSVAAPEAEIAVIAAFLQTCAKESR